MKLMYDVYYTSHHTTVHATILRCAQTLKGGGISKSPDRLNFLRATKYCIAGSLFSLFDVSYPTLL